jgi:hypothetical protein
MPAWCCSCSLDSYATVLSFCSTSRGKHLPCISYSVGTLTLPLRAVPVAVSSRHMALRRVTKELNTFPQAELGAQIIVVDELNWRVILDPPAATRAELPLLGDLFYGVRLEFAVAFPRDYPFAAMKCHLSAFPGISKTFENSLTPQARKTSFTYDKFSVRARIATQRDRMVDEKYARRAIERLELRAWAFLCAQSAASLDGGSSVSNRLITVSLKNVMGHINDLVLPSWTPVSHVLSIVDERFGYNGQATLFIAGGKVLAPSSLIGDCTVDRDATVLEANVLPRFPCHCPPLIGVLRGDWSPGLTLETLIRQFSPHYVSCADRYTTPDSCTLQGLEALTQRCRSEGEMQWMLRAASPAPNVVWSPETDADWPMFFRRTVRLLRFVAVSHPCGVMPVEVVANVVEFL